MFVVWFSSYTATLSLRLFIQNVLNNVTDAAFTYRMLQVIRDEEGQPHIVETDSTTPVNSTISVVTYCE